MSHPLDLSAELMAVFYFTEADLTANQQGILTPHQRGMLSRKILEPIAPLPGLTLRLFLLFVLVTPFVFVLTPLKNPALMSSGLLNLGFVFVSDLMAWAILVIVIGIVFASRVVSRWWRIRRELSSGRVAAIYGRIYLQVSQRAVMRGMTYDSHLVEINGLNFSITALQWQILAGYQPYAFCIYYLPASKLILSAEQRNP